MIAYLMLYATAVGLPILLAAIACSSALRRYGRAERGAWLVALGLALILPLAFLLESLGSSSPALSATLPHTGVAVAGSAPVETGVLGLPTVVAVTVEQSRLGLDEVLLLAWLLASVALALRWAVAAHRLSRVGTSWRAELMDGVRVWLTDDIGPAVSGVLRPRILMPSWLASLPEEQRSLVLLHEEEHVRARDPLLLASSRISRILAPWNPVVWLLSSRLLDAVELDCDRRVLGRRPDIQTYGDTLLTVSARDSSSLVAAAAFAESEVPLHRRIIAMTTPPRAVSVLGVLTVLALGAVLVIGSCEVPVPTARGAEEPYTLLDVSLEADGAVHVGEQPHSMEDVSAVMAPLYVGSKRSVVMIRADLEVPYRFIDQLQQELAAAEVRRVVYEVPTSLAGWSPAGDEPGPLSRGLGIVLPEEGAPAVETLISQTDVFELVVQPSGVIEAKRGNDPQVERVRAADIASLWRREVARNANLVAVVKTHPVAPYRFMLEVLAALQAADSQRISLQMLED